MRFIYTILDELLHPKWGSVKYLQIIKKQILSWNNIYSVACLLFVSLSIWHLLSISICVCYKLMLSCMF